MINVYLEIRAEEVKEIQEKIPEKMAMLTLMKMMKIWDKAENTNKRDSMLEDIEVRAASKLDIAM